MTKLSTQDQTALERRVVALGDEIDSARDVLVKLDLIQERISLCSVLESMIPRTGVLSLV